MHIYCGQLQAKSRCFNPIQPLLCAYIPLHWPPVIYQLHPTNIALWGRIGRDWYGHPPWPCLRDFQGSQGHLVWEGTTGWLQECSPWVWILFGINTCGSSSPLWKEGQICIVRGRKAKTPNLVPHPPPMSVFFQPLLSQLKLSGDHLMECGLILFISNWDKHILQ